MPKKSSPSAALVFQTTAPPPVLTMSHVGRKSLTVTWPHVYGISEYISKYRVVLNPGNVVQEIVAPNEGDLKAATFTNLAMDYAYTITVQAVNVKAGQPDLLGPMATIQARTLPEWSDPPASGIDGWTGSTYSAGRTNFTYTKSGIFLDADNWAKAAVAAGALQAPDGKTADRKEGMTWIEFSVNVAPELQITAVLMKAGHRWPQ